MREPLITLERRSSSLEHVRRVSESNLVPVRILLSAIYPKLMMFARITTTMALVSKSLHYRETTIFDFIATIDVTMYQRGSTYIMSVKKGLKMLVGGE